jgi:hypothetical protein
VQTQPTSCRVTSYEKLRKSPSYPLNSCSIGVIGETPKIRNFVTIGSQCSPFPRRACDHGAAARAAPGRSRRLPFPPPVSGIAASGRDAQPGRAAVERAFSASSSSRLTPKGVTR